MALGAPRVILSDVDEQAQGNAVLARATIHLPGGLRPGGLYWVDASSDYVRDCLKVGHLNLMGKDDDVAAPVDLTVA